MPYRLKTEKKIALICAKWLAQFGHPLIAQAIAAII